MRKHMGKNSSDGTSKKVRRSFNFIDFILILFAIVVIIAAINIVSPMSIINKFKSDDVYSIQYTVEFTGVDIEFIDKIKETDTVVDAVSKHTLGSVTAVDYNTPYSELQYNEAEKAGVLAVYQDRYNVIITITSSGTYHKGEGYSINDRRIAVGEKLSLRFPDYVGEGYCIGLSAES